MEKDGATIAVFGTTHLVPEAMTWLSPSAERALRSADLILTETSLFRHEEVTISDEEAALLAPRSLLPPGRSLWEMAARRLGAATTARIRATMAANELNPATYTAMRPWLVCRDLQIPPRLRSAITPEDRDLIEALATAHGAPDLLPPDLKIEMYGVANGVETRFLESEYERAYNFSQLSDGDALDCAARQAERSGARPTGQAIAAQYAELLAIWAAGDAERARTMVERDQTRINPAWSQLFLQAREAFWMRQIASECAIPRRNCFIAVGMGHLGGADGLLKRIEALGYRRLAPQG